jgi:asparagine synthase (glutamine-hydrolysing)
VRELISEESLKRTGYFDVDQVQQDCAFVAAQGSSRSLGRFYSLGLGGVVATQLWHHVYLGGGLCGLPVDAQPAAPEEAPFEDAVSA